MIFKFQAGDILEMKKSHPCGENFFTVLFAGSDVKIRCRRCGREIIVSRIKLEKSVKSVIIGDNNDS